MNKTMLMTLILALLLAFPLAASAGKKNVSFDMANYTCAELLKEKDDDAGMLLVWIDGYLSGKTGDTRVDMKFLGELATEVGKACAKSGRKKVLDVVDEVVQ